MMVMMMMERTEYCFGGAVVACATAGHEVSCSVPGSDRMFVRPANI